MGLETRLNHPLALYQVCFRSLGIPSSFVSSHFEMRLVNLSASEPQWPGPKHFMLANPMLIFFSHTVVTMDDVLQLYGSKIGAIEGSPEHTQGLRKRAEVY